MTPVEFTPGARRDLARLEDFLITKNERAAMAAVRTIAAAVVSLGEFPERGVRVHGDCWRELAVRFGRDGYVIRYRVTPAAVVVNRIFHAREHR